MNSKQKVGYTLLGAVIMLVGIGVGAIVSPPLIAQHNGVFDEIQCSTLRVIDKSGKDVVHIAASEDGNAVTVVDRSGNRAVQLVASENGNAVTVFNRSGNRAIQVGAKETMKGNEYSVDVFDKAGNTAINLGTTEVGEVSVNGVIIHGRTGQEQIVLGTAIDHASAIVIVDRAGKVKWRAP